MIPTLFITKTLDCDKFYVLETSETDTSIRTKLIEGYFNSEEEAQRYIDTVNLLPLKYVDSSYQCSKIALRDFYQNNPLIDKLEVNFVLSSLPVTVY